MEHNTAGCHASEKVNCHNAVDIGIDMVMDFLRAYPDGFYSRIHGRVVTMEAMKKGIKINDKVEYDMEKI